MKIPKVFLIFTVFLLFISCDRTEYSSDEDLSDKQDYDFEEKTEPDEQNSKPDEDESQIDEYADSDNEPEAKPLRNVTTEGNFGRIKISFTLDFPDEDTRRITVFFEGGCNGESAEEALIIEDISALPNGTHTVTWPSWDQQAGCSGEIKITVAADTGEFTASSEPFELENTGTNSGFASFPLTTQGITGTDEMNLYNRSVESLLKNPGVDFVATRLEEDLYEVVAERGFIRFKRVNTNRGYVYEIIDSDGENPLKNQDATAFPTYNEELAAGGNPEGSGCEDLEYSASDPRMSFPEPEEDSYPFGYERLTAYFDHPDSSDFIVNPKGYSHYEEGHAGNHGSLNMMQSRSPLLIWGKGIAHSILERPVRHTDIAPTIAELFGMPDIEGVDERGIKSAFNKLKWQDGSVIKEILNGEKAEHVIIIVADGANMTEVYKLMDEYPDDFKNFNKMKNEGVFARFGMITNFPSVTYPSHNVLGSGIYSGHHGLVDNSYYLRSEDKVAAPISETASTGKYFNPVYGEAETLHTAVHRVFGLWENAIRDGGYTMSIFDPSVKEADTSDLELTDRSGKIVSFDTLLPSLDTPLPNIPVSEYILLGTQQSEGIALSELEILFKSGPNPMPKYVIMNFPTSDSAGHAKGPHGNLMKDVYEHIDKDIGVVFKWFQNWGILDKSVIIFTSDHGMQMGDPARSGSFTQTLKNAGISFVEGTGNGVYLK